MIKRPKNTDTEKDIFQMQKEFLMEKKKDSNFQPAAKVVKLSKRKSDWFDAKPYFFVHVINW